ncbi:hypothetical protein D3C83_16770 [compost metagenome]
MSERVAFLNDTLVAPLEVAAWYGISVPCSMVASTWSEVITRGLETILPLPSACSALNSRSTNFVRLGLNRIIENTLPPAAGRFTLRLPVEKLGTVPSSPAFGATVFRLPPMVTAGARCAALLPLLPNPKGTRPPPSSR